jgi:DNA repair protein RadC
MPTKDLLALVLRRTDDDELKSAESALALYGGARDAALRSLRSGPQLLAVVELGRRAWMGPSPAGRRIRAPVDVAAVVAPRVVDDPAMDERTLGACGGEVGDERVWLLALDARLTVARVHVLPPSPGALLRSALAVGASYIIAARTRPTLAVPTHDDVRLAESLAAAGRTVGVRLLDVVVLGDDGFCSLLRLGIVPSLDQRYR